jgi:hypothetical protein
MLCCTKAVRLLLSGLMILLLAVMSALADDEEGFRLIFDGKTLDGWDGNPKFWRIEDGTIVGETTAENPTSHNTFLIWRGGEPADFELKAEFRLHNGNSGIQYRSIEKPQEWGRWVIGGYQADMDGANQYTGILYEERGRGIVALQGQKVEVGDDHKPRVIKQFAEPKDVLSHVKVGDWNDYHINAKGNRLVQIINGQKTMKLIDNDKDKRRMKGLIALQLHAGPPMKVEFRNLRLKESDFQEVFSADALEISIWDSNSDKEEPSAEGETVKKK